jgi:hypothetical protein
MYADVKIPKNQQSRLAPDVWLAGEAIARHRGMSTNRDAFEYCIRAVADKLAESSAEFKAVWDGVKKEGIEPDTKSVNPVNEAQRNDCKTEDDGLVF